MTTKDFKMTDEVRQQLMGLLPMDNTSTHKFTPPMFDAIEDENFRPVYELRQFKNEDVLTLKQMLTDDAVNMGKTKKKKPTIQQIADKNEEYMKILHRALVGWENVYYPVTGELREYDGTVEDLMNNYDECLMAILSEALRISGVRL